MIVDTSAQETVLAKESLFINIPGIDVKTGMALYNGDEEIYCAVLRSFVPNARKVIDRLRDVSRAALPDYMVQAHGLKSISAGIGAEAIRAAAAELEGAAKAGDLSAVLAGNKTLLLEAEKLVSGIEAWLTERGGENQRPRLDRPDPALLKRLRESCEAYDMNGIDDAMDELERPDYTEGASLIRWLRDTINALDFATAAARLAEYEKEST